MLDAINDEDLKRAARPLQSEAELFLQCCKDRWSIRHGDAVIRDGWAENWSWSPLEIEIESTDDTGVIHYIRDAGIVAASAIAIKMNNRAELTLLPLDTTHGKTARKDRSVRSINGTRGKPVGATY